jgi:hypothetical protein
MFISGIWPIELAAGLADGIGMFICIGGEEAGVGEATGICIPGIFISGVGFGVAIDSGVGEGTGEAFGGGIFIPGICCGLVCAANTPNTRLKADTKPAVLNISIDRRIGYPVLSSSTRGIEIGRGPNGRRALEVKD